MMRVLGAVACMLSVPAVGAPSCVEVHTIEETRWQHSGPLVRITTLRDGKPLGNVRVVFELQNDPHSQIPFVTNQQGVVNSLPLPAGRYHVNANGPESPNEYADMFIEVAGQRRKTISALSMIIPPVFPIEKLADVETTPVREHLRKFHGLLQDQTASPIGRAFVQVFRKEKPFEEAAKLRTDEEGRFEAKLAPGAYVAFFSYSGFREERRGFTIGLDGDVKPLSIRLQVGSCT
jgi:hypothetical protein